MPLGERSARQPDGEAALGELINAVFHQRRLPVCGAHAPTISLFFSHLEAVCLISTEGMALALLSRPPRGDTGNEMESITALPLPLQRP